MMDQAPPTLPYKLDRPCPKCGDRSAATRHYKGNGVTEECIYRSCHRCGYGWKELPLDHKPAEAGEVAK